MICILIFVHFFLFINWQRMINFIMFIEFTTLSTCVLSVIFLLPVAFSLLYVIVCKLVPRSMRHGALIVFTLVPQILLAFSLPSHRDSFLKNKDRHLTSSVMSILRKSSYLFARRPEFNLLSIAVSIFYKLLCIIRDTY